MEIKHEKLILASHPIIALGRNEAVVAFVASNGTPVISAIMPCSVVEAAGSPQQYC